MTLNEARSHVIYDFIYIEGRIDDILVREIQPRTERRRFVKEILLDTAIMPTSSKFKLLRHLIQLNNWPSTNEFHFHRFLQIRNQFAHVGAKVQLLMNVPQRENLKSVEVTENFILEALNGKGLLEKINYRQALQEFNLHNAELRRVIHAILDIPTENAADDDEKPAAKLQTQPHEGDDDFWQNPRGKKLAGKTRDGK